MLEYLLTAWHNLPLVVKLPLDFWLSIIVVRGIVAKDITSWLEDRGFIKKKEQSLIYRTLDYLYFHTKGLIPRKAAIWEHFKHGHPAKVAGCSEGACTIFHS